MKKKIQLDLVCFNCFVSGLSSGGHQKAREIRLHHVTHNECTGSQGHGPGTHSGMEVALWTVDGSVIPSINNIPTTLKTLPKEHAPKNSH